MGPAEFGTVLSSLKSAADIARAMTEIRDATTVQTKAFELTREIIAAQQGTLSALAAQQSLLVELRELKDKIAQFEAWDSEKQRFELVDHGCGTYTRVLKADFANGEPKHQICAQCFEKGKKGLLQSRGRFHGREKVSCMLCEHEVMLGCPGSLPISYPKGRRA